MEAIDSSFLFISSNSQHLNTGLGSTSSLNIINNDLEHSISSSPFSCEPFDGLLPYSCGLYHNHHHNNNNLHHHHHHHHHHHNHQQHNNHHSHLLNHHNQHVHNNQTSQVGQESSCSPSSSSSSSSSSFSSYSSASPSSMSDSCLRLNYANDDLFGGAGASGRACSPSTSFINQYPSLDHLDEQPMMSTSPSIISDLISSSSSCGSSNASIAGYHFINNDINNVNSHDNIDHDHHHINSPFIQMDPTSCENSDLNGTLTSFVVGDLGADSDGGYNSGVDLFSSSSMVDCGDVVGDVHSVAGSDSNEAYYFRMAIEPSTTTTNNNNNNNNTSINQNQNYLQSQNNNNNNIFNNNNHHLNQNHQAIFLANKTTENKRSVLMNLLIDGSDVGAGYTCVNRRSLVQYNH